MEVKTNFRLEEREGAVISVGVLGDSVGRKCRVDSGARREAQEAEKFLLFIAGNNKNFAYRRQEDRKRRGRGDIEVKSGDREVKSGDKEVACKNYPKLRAVECEGSRSHSAERGVKNGARLKRVKKLARHRAA
eukprot:1121451-Pleurochrysis_carterae.AAC.6